MRLEIVDLRAASERGVEAVLAALPEARRERIARYRHLEDRARSALAEAAVRSAAARATGCPACEVALTWDERGKPGLPGDAPFCFSISHSGALAVCAFDGASVGADVEQVKHKEMRDIAKSCFSARENERIAASPDPARAFYGLWTAKESAVKFMGVGLAGLRGVEIDGERALFEGRALPCRVLSFETAPGLGRLCPPGVLDGEALYALSLCAREGDAPPRVDAVFRTAEEVASEYLALCRKAP